MINQEIQKKFQFFAESDWNSQRIIYLDTLEQLAAERDRADRAEARLADVWDEGVTFGWHSTELRTDENPYRKSGL